MVHNRQKVKVGEKLAIFEPFFKVHFLGKYTSNEAKTKL